MQLRMQHSQANLLERQQQKLRWDRWEQQQRHSSHAPHPAVLPKVLRLTRAEAKSGELQARVLTTTHEYPKYPKVPMSTPKTSWPKACPVLTNSLGTTVRPLHTSK